MSASGTVERDSLILAAQTGDPAAIGRLLAVCQADARRYARRHCQVSDVDDAVQQALISLVQALPSFRGECAPASYAYRIAVRTAVAARRRSRQSHARHQDEALAREIPASERSGDRFVAHERKELLRELLEELPDEQAEALALQAMLGWSLEEISATSGSPVNTIRSRLRLAKEALRRKIEGTPGLADALGVQS